MPEYKRQKAEVDAAEELKKHRQCSGDVPSRKGKGCRGKSCNNPCCAAAEAVQREMPFLDKEAASKLVRARHLFKEYRQHIEVMPPQHAIHCHTVTTCMQLSLLSLIKCSPTHADCCAH